MSSSFAAARVARKLYERVVRDPIALPLPVLNLCVALWLLTTLNAPFWRALWGAAGGWDAGRVPFLLSLPIFVLLWVWLVLECLTWGRAAKPVLAILLGLSAVLAYFMSSYAVLFDDTMLANIVQTDPAEARELLSAPLLGWLLLFAAVPVGLLTRVRVARGRWHMQILGKAMTIAALLSGLAVTTAPFFQSYAPLLRNHRELRLYLVPTNFLSATHSHVRKRLAHLRRTELARIQATRAVPVQRAAKPALTVIVVGETARAANWGLNGYDRPTTPRLATDSEVINFENVSSCGTATAVSLPCMFLDAGRAGFGNSLAAQRENLLDVLQHAGLKVLWRDNNSGCKGLCERIAFEDLVPMKVPGLCTGGECYDEILLDGLQEKLDAYDRDTVVVLHMKGSHGPAYYLRYPPAFEYFTPVCRTNQFDRCERKAIVNAYDNTLRYTDYVIARTLDLLRRNADRFDASLVYVSDHGESLGEHGLYLHGVPYALAPSEQTRVPMLIWLSRGARERFGIDVACLRDKRRKPLSHDNLYHSTLGLLGVVTTVYRAERDIFRDCRTGPGAVDVAVH
jgi:lipid A ethanolaminephosphotransferase